MILFDQKLQCERNIVSLSQEIDDLAKIINPLRDKMTQLKSEKKQLVHDLNKINLEITKHMLGNHTPVYSVCNETGLRCCELFKYLLVREDGMTMNIRPGYDNSHWKNKWILGVVTKGYRLIKLPGATKCGVNSKTFKVHRLVGLAFIPNPDNLPFIDHIDGNTLNNHVSNLRWVTNRQNQENRKLHRETGKIPGVTVYCKKNGNVTYTAWIRVNKIRIKIGKYDNKEDAINARKCYIDEHKLT